APLLELPISVAPRSRLHFIGTAVTTFPWQLVKAIYRGLKRDRLVNLELHAIDVLDESDGMPKALARVQRDLKVPVGEKLRRLKDGGDQADPPPPRRRPGLHRHVPQRGAVGGAAAAPEHRPDLRPRARGGHLVHRDGVRARPQLPRLPRRGAQGNASLSPADR